MCPHSVIFWSIFSRTRNEFEDLLCESPYLVRIREKKDQKTSEYRHTLRSEKLAEIFWKK